MTQLGLDRYANLDSLIHRWEPRTKLIGLLVLIFAFSTIQDWRLLLPMYLITAILFFLSKIPAHFLRSRLKLPGYFIAFLVILLPFISGSTELFRIGPLALRQEGLLNALIIASRFICIIAVTLVLFGTAPFLTSIKALRSLGLPDILADMILLTYRYLFEMADTLQAMRTAIRLRGFNGGKFSLENLKTLASLIGSLLVRSYEHAEQVYSAMILRGYGSGQMTAQAFSATPFDMVLTSLVIGLAVALAVGQWLLG